MRISTILALGALAAATPSLAAEPTVPAETLLTVSATGEVTRVPDIAHITAGVVTDAVEARAALSANSSQMTRVVAALRKAGVADRDIQTSNISLNPRYDYPERQSPRLIGYQAINNVSVKLRRLDKAGDIIDALVSEGANQVNGPTFSLDKPDAANDEARLDAMAKARARADLYAKAAGMSVKRIVSISEVQNNQPPYPLMKQAMRAESADAASPVAAGEVGMNVDVTVVFELQ